MLASFAIALTTIPMPKDVIYPFEGPSYGNTATCEAQGLVYITGSAIVIFMNGILNIYYVCTLRYKMKAETFSKFIEPILLVMGITVPVITIIMILANQGLINPTPYESYCADGSYPFDCNDRDAMECIRGGGSNGVAQFQSMFLFTMVTALVTLATSMLLIILTFYKSHNTMKEHVTTEDGSPRADITDSTEKNKQEEEVHNQESQHNMTKIITSQAFMYLGSFLFTWIFTVLSYLGDFGMRRNQYASLIRIEIVIPTRLTLNCALCYAYPDMSFLSAFAYSNTNFITAILPVSRTRRAVTS